MMQYARDGCVTQKRTFLARRLVTSLARRVYGAEDRHNALREHLPAEGKHGVRILGNNAVSFGRRGVEEGGIVAFVAASSDDGVYDPTGSEHLLELRNA